MVSGSIPRLELGSHIYISIIICSIRVLCDHGIRACQFLLCFDVQHLQFAASASSRMLEPGLADWLSVVYSIWEFFNPWTGAFLIDFLNTLQQLVASTSWIGDWVISFLPKLDASGSSSTVEGGLGTEFSVVIGCVRELSDFGPIAEYLIFCRSLD